jgi:polyribonucleotide nucleotidyltransferase
MYAANQLIRIFIMEIKKEKEGEVTRFKTEFAGRKLIIETGRMAGQADGSCTVQFGDTVVLATAVISNQPREGVDFFPLMVDYEERLYAAGKIKGSRWIKREGRPSDEAVTSARLIDRAIRPLFDQSIKNDVQVILTVLSFDGENDSDIASLIATSAAVAISEIPWQGPIAGIRLGRIASESDQGYEWVVNPTFNAREKSDLDLIIAGDGDKVIMLEGNAKEISEEVIQEGIKFSQKHIKRIVELIKEVEKEVGKEKIKTPIEAPEEEDQKDSLQSQKELVTKVEDWIKKNVSKVLFDKKLPTKKSRKEVVEELKEQMLEYLQEEGIGKERRSKAASMFKGYIEQIVSEEILKSERRVDGRKLDEIRPLKAEVGLLPRTHGSALFSRGETQVLSVITLGAPGDEQFLEGMEETGRKRYMHHYNFPPFSVGETGMMRSPSRREIGHGALAEKALLPVLPTKEDFPYTVRVVSEVLSSNGSSSMASVCGSSLALMDAGVPIKKSVAGIAMGLASDQKGNYKILTDLQDLEDGPSGMDFKIAGTTDGITAIQMDTKTLGLSLDIVKETLEQGKKARLQILEVMAKTIAAPRKELSPYAPRIISFKINPEKIREVIGPGGKVINEIIDNTGVQIDIDPDGMVMITATEVEGGKKAEEWIKNLTREIKVGEVFKGKVTRILDFGAFVELTPNQEGMVHISELAPYRVAKVGDVVKVGDIVPVKVIKIDEQGRINLSMKALQSKSDSNKPRRTFRGDKRPRFRR